MVLQRSHGSPVQLPPVAGLTAANSGSPDTLGRTVDGSLFGGLVSVLLASASALCTHFVSLSLFGCGPDWGYALAAVANGGADVPPGPGSLPAAADFDPRRSPCRSARPPPPMSSAR